MKITSRKKKEQEVEIELELNEVDDNIIPVEEEEIHEQFEFYRENWIIQGAVKLGCSVEFDHQRLVTTFFYRQEKLMELKDEDLQSDAHCILNSISDTIDQINRRNIYEA